jgi:Ca2+-transporting ATPase
MPEQSSVSTTGPASVAKASEQGVARWHAMPFEEVLTRHQTVRNGLSEAEVAKRREASGLNVLREGRKKTLLRRFLEQFANVMIIILVVAAVISAFVGHPSDAAIILSVVVVNALLGVIQEARAEKALDALKKMSAPFVRVQRGGQVLRVKTEELVQGDLVLLEAGDVVPADLRLVETASLKIEEAPLTGESVPVEKDAEVVVKPDAVLGDRINMAYSGCSVTYGRGVGVVTAIGMDTEVGKIATHLSEEVETATPLQIKLAELGKVLTVGVLAVAVVVFVVGLLNGHELIEMFMTAVSLAVAAIPEGLPAVVTIVLAMGVQKMARRNAIIRKLSAVETLGSTQIICSDKTGTLTQNRMTVKEVYMNGTLEPVTTFDGNDPGQELFMDGFMLCNDSRSSTADAGVTVWVGDPTETALVEFAEGKGYHKDSKEGRHPRVAEIPFDSGRKLMTTVHPFGKTFRFMTKGAPDVLLDRCDRIFINDEILPMNGERRQHVLNANRTMGEKALRVLALGIKELDAEPEHLDPEKDEQGLIFIGLVGMIDPPRPEVIDAVRVCREAGIRPVMITGDHVETASAIAREIGILQEDSKVIMGKDLAAIPQEVFEQTVDQYAVYARVAPEHKVRIVKAWQKKGNVVAMTGDGVNDAPALKASDIGVGMGITGTEVSKSVSDMVLADDNFATIVTAVEEGRKIYGNIRKAIQFLLSSNLGEVVALFLATLFNWTILMPIHILWVNLVTDTLPALALGMEPADRGLMRRKPRGINESFFADGIGVNVVYQGVLEGLLTLTAYGIGRTQWGQETGMTMAFLSLALIQLFHSMNARSATESILKIGVFKNRKLLGAIALAGLLQVCVILFPGLNSLFHVEHLSWAQWGISLGLSFAIIPLVEIVKWFQRRRRAEDA